MTSTRESWRRDAQARLIEMGGADVVELVDQDAKKHGDPIDLDPGECRGLSLVELAREALAFDDVRTVGVMPMDIFGHALTCRSASGVFGEFHALLEVALRRVILAGYRTTLNTWPLFCAKGFAQNFHPHPRPRFQEVRLEPPNERGEFPRFVENAGAESITVDTRHDDEIIWISRQDLMNGDIGFALGHARRRGMAAGNWIEGDVYELLASNGGLGPKMSDGHTLFHQLHHNITLDAPLSDDAIGQDRNAMASGDYRYLTPSVLVISEQESQVSTVVEKQFDDVVRTAHVEGRRRYLFASPISAPTLEVAILGGQRMPGLDLARQPSTDGLGWKIRLDYGVAARNWCSAVTNAGGTR